MKRLILFLTFSISAIFAFGQGSVQNWQLEWADTSDTGGSVYRFMSTDTSTGIRNFVTRDFFAEILYKDSMNQVYVNLEAETDTLYDAAYNQLTNGDTISNKFPNEIEVNVVRAINNDSIVLVLDTLSYSSSPDYVLGLHNVTVNDTVISGTIKLVPKDLVSTLNIGLDFQEQTQNQIISANQVASDTARKRSGWAMFIALFSVVFSIGYSVLPKK